MKSSRAYTKKDRIRSRKEFQEIYKTGKRFSTKYYLIFFKNTSNPGEAAAGGPRLGISIPGRFGNAVFRNYQKRVLRGFFRKEIKSLNVSVTLLFVLKQRPESSDTLIEDLGKVAVWLKKHETTAK